MRAFVNELALPHVRSQQGQCEPKDYEKDFTVINACVLYQNQISMSHCPTRKNK